MCWANVFNLVYVVIMGCFPCCILVDRLKFVNNDDLGVTTEVAYRVHTIIPSSLVRSGG